LEFIVFPIRSHHISLSSEDLNVEDENSKISEAYSSKDRFCKKKFHKKIVRC